MISIVFIINGNTLTRISIEFLYLQIDHWLHCFETEVKYCEHNDLPSILTFSTRITFTDLWMVAQ